MSTSTLHGEFLCLLFLQAHRDVPVNRIRPGILPQKTQARTKSMILTVTVEELDEVSNIL